MIAREGRIISDRSQGAALHHPSVIEANVRISRKLDADAAGRTFIAINDLCRRYSVDLSALSRNASMDWDDLAKLAADPLVTIASATINYPSST
jgi:hypothetical protein